MGFFLEHPNDWEREDKYMGGAARPGGCESCGRLVQVSYTGWQFLCNDCRSELVREKAREAAKARAAAKVEAEEEKAVSAGK